MELDFDLETSLNKKGTRENLRQKVEESLSNPKFQRLLAKKQLNYSGDAELLENYYAAIEERKAAEETEKQAKDFSKKAQAEWLESSFKNTAEDDFWTEADSAKAQEAEKKAQEAKKMVEEAKDNVKQASLDYANSVKKDFIEVT